MNNGLPLEYCVSSCVPAFLFLLSSLRFFISPTYLEVTCVNPGFFFTTTLKHTYIKHMLLCRSGGEKIDLITKPVSI